MNKKVVFLVVLLECILAVFMVSFFGQAIEDSKKQILCQDIYFTYEDGTKIEDGTMIEYKLSDTNMSYQLYWVMETSQTSKREVHFESNNPLVQVNDGDGVVNFLFADPADAVSVVITIYAMDGSLKKDTITWVPKRGGGIVDM